MVRCGSCRTQFDVPGPGRFSCPVCGSVNMVRAAAATPGAPPAGPPNGPTAAPPPPRPPDPPSPRVTCPACDFRFIVGNVETAKCPNCGAEVATDMATPAGDDGSAT
jgi:LSD1 subclass zinc finger protein